MFKLGKSTEFDMFKRFKAQGMRLTKSPKTFAGATLHLVYGTDYIVVSTPQADGSVKYFGGKRSDLLQCFKNDLDK